MRRLWRQAQCRACKVLRQVSTSEPLPETAQTKTSKIKTGKRWVVGVLVGAVVLLALIILSVAHSDDQPSSKDVAAITALDAGTAADKAAKTEKPAPVLDYTKPIYTTDHAIICPISLLSDRRADHDIAAVMDMYMSTFTAESKAAKLGCEVWTSGIEVAAKPMDGMAPLVAVNTSAFTVDAHLTNNADGTMQSADSSPAQPSKDASSSPAQPSPSTHPTSEPVQVPQGSLKSTRDLEKYVGTFPCGNGLLEETALLTSLKQVLGSDYTAYREFMGVSSCEAIEKKGDFLLMDVSEPHVGPGYSSLILVRLSDGQVFLLWINKAREADKQWQFYGPRPVPDEVGQIVENSLNEGLGGFVYDVKVTVHGEDFDVTGRH